MKKTKTLKGISLVECITALAVLGIMGSLLIMGVQTVYASRKDAEKIHHNTAYETPYAEKKSNDVFSATNISGMYDKNEKQKIQIDGVEVEVDYYAIIDPNDDRSGVTFQDRSHGFTYFEKSVP